MLHVVHGQNELAVSDRVHELTSTLDPTGFSITTVVLTDATLAEVRIALQAAPFFGGPRVALLRGPALSRKRPTTNEEPDENAGADEEPRAGGERGLDWAQIVDVLSSSPASTHVICWISGAMPSTHSLLKRAREHSWTVESFRAPRGAELLDWVSARAESIGSRITPDAVQLLLEMLYPTAWRAETRWDATAIDMRLIATEIEKLACGTDSGTIDAVLVSELIADRSGYTAFRLTDVVFTGQVNASLVELDNVLETGEAPERVLGQLSSELILRSAVRSTSDLPASQVAAALRTTEGRITAGRGKRAATDQSTLRECAELLRESEAAVKSGHLRDTATAIVPLTAELATRLAHRRGVT